MSNVVYEIKFTLADDLESDNKSLSSEVKKKKKKDEPLTEYEQIKENQKILKDSKLVGAVAGAIMVTQKGYQTYSVIRNAVNTQRMVNLSIRGDNLASRNMQLKIAREDRIANEINSTVTSAFQGAIAGASIGMLFGSAGAGAVIGGVVSAVWDFANSKAVELNNYIADMRAYQANVYLESYVKQLDANRLVKNINYTR